MKTRIAAAGSMATDQLDKASPSFLVDAVEARRGGAAVDPTGVGNAFRDGFIAAEAVEVSHEQATRLGCAQATVILESAVTPEYHFSTADRSGRMAREPVEQQRTGL